MDRVHRSEWTLLTSYWRTSIALAQGELVIMVYTDGLQTTPYNFYHEEFPSTLASERFPTYSDLIPPGKSKASIGSNRGSYLPLVKVLLEAATSPSSAIGLPQPADKAEHLLTNGSIGVDKIRISVAMDPDSLDLPLFLQSLLGKGAIQRGPIHIAGFPDIYLSWQVHRNLLYLEFNPSRFVWPQGLQLCPFGLLISVVKTVIQRVIYEGDPLARPDFMTDKKSGEIYTEYPSNWAEQIIVNDIHLTQDFCISEPKFNLGQLEGTQPSRTHGAKSIRNRGVLGTLTHVASRTTPRVQLYDKYAERLKNPALEAPAVSRGAFRFEVQFPRKALRNLHPALLSGCTEERLLELLEKKWKDSKFHRDLVWEGQMASQMHASKFSSARANELLGYAFTRQHKIPQNAYSAQEIKRLDNDLEYLRVDLRLPLTKQGAPYGRLDPTTGGMAPPSKTTYRRRKAD